MSLRVVPELLVVCAVLRGSHPVVDQVEAVSRQLLAQHFSALLTCLGAPKFVSKVADVLSAEQVFELLDGEDVSASADQVFSFLSEWSALAGRNSLDYRQSPWRACRFAHLSAANLVKAATLEGNTIPSRIVSLSIALERLLEEQGEAECEKQRKALGCEELEDWLRAHRLRRRTGLRVPQAGEIELRIHRSSSPDEEQRTSESKNTTIVQFKQRLCSELGLNPSRIRIWDYFNRRPYALLENDLNRTLEQCRIFNHNPIMLEEQGWILPAPP